ncbi:MAG TPA: secretin N-terminal domain-containing protein [Verrucomicrobiae bacterium]|jgi:general secretion pathway protein D
MNLKRFMPLLLLLPLVIGRAALSDPNLDGGWQSVQVQLPPRNVQPEHRSGVPSATTPRLAPNAPGLAPAPATGPAVSPKFPAFPKPAAPAASSNGPAPAAATANTNEPADITYNFPGVPVEQLLDVYADLVGRTILRANSGQGAVPKDATITLKTENKLTRTEAIQALETILGMNGITIVNIGEKFAKVSTEAQAPHEGGAISTNASGIPESGKMVTQIVQVKYTDIKDISDVLKPFSRMPDSIIALPSTQTLILRDYAENVARMVEMVKKIDIVTPLIIKPHIIPIRYALAADMAAALGQLGAGAGGSVGKSSSGANFSLGSRGGGSGFGGGGNGMNGMNGMGGGYGSSGGFGSTGGYSGQAVGTSPLGSAATSGRSSFQNNLNRIVSNAANAGTFQLFGQTKIIADERTNSLLVFANDEDMKMITNIIDKLDVVLQQVLIDAIIMEVDLGSSLNTEISYLSQRQGGSTVTGAGGLQNLQNASGFLSGTSSTNAGGVASVAGSTLANLPSGFSYFAKFGDDLNVVMEAAASDSRSIILSRPRIQTSHAVPADMFIGKTVPYITGSYNYGYSAGPSSQYSQLEVGIHLQILPLINPDGLVVMDIQVDVEGIIGETPINGTDVPITSKQQAGAKVAVKDGETIMLGGFIQDNPSVTDAGVPWLMNVPLLGNLFKGRLSSTSRQELVMLLRPTVLPTPQIAADVATRERNKLAGIKQGEWQLRNEEKGRYQKIEDEMLKDAKSRAKKEKKDAEKRAKEVQKYGTNAPSLQSVPPLED